MTVLFDELMDHSIFYNCSNYFTLLKYLIHSIYLVSEVYFYPLAILVGIKHFSVIIWVLDFIKLFFLLHFFIIVSFILLQTKLSLRFKSVEYIISLLNEVLFCTEKPDRYYNSIFLDKIIGSNWIKRHLQFTIVVA